MITLLLGITSTHRNGTWAKLNARLLGTRICWLLIDSCFHSFITLHWRHWCREKTVNSCCAFLPKPLRQTVVNHLSCGFNPNLSQTFFSVSGPFWSTFFFPVITIVWAFVLRHAGRYRLHLMYISNTDAQMSKVLSNYDSFACY